MTRYDDFLDDLYPSWHARALCNGMDPELFFPTTPPPTAKGQPWRDRRLAATREARKTCAQCPVQPECNESRRKHEEQWGIWAGLDLEAGRNKKDADAA